MDQHTLNPGRYIICDPAYIILKNQAGDALFQKLIQLFYKDANKFHHIIIKDQSFYLFRTLGGDGIFDGVGTDTGLLMVVEVNQLIKDEKFRQDYTRGKIIKFETEKPVIATYDNFDLIISNGISIHTA